MMRHMTLRRGTGRRPRRRRGQAVIEMALVMSMLLILTFGMVDFGMMLTGYIRATTCVREAARAAVVRKAGAADYCNKDQLLKIFEASPGVSVVVTPSNYMTAPTGSAVTVSATATYKWKALAPLINAFAPGDPWSTTMTMKAEATMRLEGRRP